jgi:CubicO group peptidase (beta-lactamase class C family)
MHESTDNQQNLINQDGNDYDVDNQFPLNGGAGHSGSGVIIPASDLARIGHLYLNDGVWNNQQLLSSSWISQATSVQVPPATPMFKQRPYFNPAMHCSHMDIDGRGIYGFHWWVNGKKPGSTTNLMPDAPGGTYYRGGSRDNFLVVVPEWNMVIVRLGEAEDKIPLSEEADVWNTVLKTIGEGLISPSSSFAPLNWRRSAYSLCQQVEIGGTFLPNFEKLEDL